MQLCEVYSTCLFCHAHLGRNEAIEYFPVGRRLAYDAAKGRLWVVCRRCERWNLTPQEERWEAIEEAERLYRGARRRMSTENVGLARVADGTELVRVGAPLRPEFAAWRYGDQFGRRRQRQAGIAVGGVAALGAVVIGGVAAGVSMGAFSWIITQAFIRIVNGNPNTVLARVPDGDTLVEVRRKHLLRTVFVPSESGPFGLQIERREGRMSVDGDEAARIAAALLPAVNRFGGSRDAVADAVGRIESAGGSESLVTRAGRAGIAAVGYDAPHVPAHRWSRAADRPWLAHGLLTLDTVTRLALEMALHEEQERRAIAGELAPLERAWREAEEIAAIADDLLLPASIGERLGQLKARRTARDGAASSPSSESGSATNS